jgi:hypothetical protein
MVNCQLTIFYYWQNANDHLTNFCSCRRPNALSSQLPRLISAGCMAVHFCFSLFFFFSRFIFTLIAKPYGLISLRQLGA